MQMDEGVHAPTQRSMALRERDLPRDELLVTAEASKPFDGLGVDAALGDCGAEASCPSVRADSLNPAVGLCAWSLAVCVSGSSARY